MIRSIVVCSVAIASLACGGPQPEPTSAEGANSATSGDMRSAESGNWVTLTGTVVSATNERFELDYGAGVITVEMNEVEDYAAASRLIENDRVMVYGRIDDDFLEQRTLVAEAVYIEDLGTHFFATGTQHADYPTLTVADFSPRIELAGTVAGVVGRTLLLDTGAGTVDVDTASLSYDPLDSEGYQRIALGDRVRVAGRIGDALFTEHDLVADAVLSMGAPSNGSDESQSSSSQSPESRSSSSQSQEARSSSSQSSGSQPPAVATAEAESSAYDSSRGVY